MKGKRSTPMTLEESLAAAFRKAYKRPRHRAKCGFYHSNGMPHVFADVEMWARFWKVEEWIARKTLMQLVRRGYAGTITHLWKRSPTKPVEEKIYYNIGPHNLWLKSSTKHRRTRSLGAEAEDFNNHRKPRHRRANEFNRNPRTDL
jgi:hypothetical protein